MRCPDSFHLNAFAQIEMSAYSLESNLAQLQIAEFVFSSGTKELQKHLLAFKYLICADWQKQQLSLKLITLPTLCWLFWTLKVM